MAENCISVKYSIEIMNKLEYEVVTLGNHEFDYGIDQLETLEKLLNCSYISSNYCYRKDKKPIYPPYKIIEKGGKKNRIYWSCHTTNFIKNIFNCFERW